MGLLLSAGQPEGETLLYTGNPWAAGAVGGATTNGVRQGLQYLSGRDRDTPIRERLISFVRETGTSAVGGGIGGAVGNRAANAFGSRLPPLVARLTGGGLGGSFGGSLVGGVSGWMDRGPEGILPGAGRGALSGGACGTLSGLVLLRPQRNVRLIPDEMITRWVPQEEIQLAPVRATIPEGRTGHIFRTAEGHLADTAANRQQLTDVANNSAARLGTDVHGNVWHAVTRPDGTQVWVQVRNNQIINGGVNQTPRTYNQQTGLSAPEPPRGGS